MEKKINLIWDIYNGEIDIEKRYCHNCGKKVEFKDSLKRRQNANGKNIFRFAIYKCPKGHTWNKKIDTFKTVSGLENVQEKFNIEESNYEELRVIEFKEEGISEINILLNVLQQKVRTDKFLSSKIKDISRSEIVRLIEAGAIKVNGEKIKTKINLKEKDVVTLIISKFDDN
jgi:hypothetical protein